MLVGVRGGDDDDTYRGGSVLMAEQSETMKCPYCGSKDVECDETRDHHVHLCNGCGHKDIYRIPR